MEKAMFGAGCFWGVEAAFRKVKGVKKTAVGYSGGNTKNPTYKEVCTGTTNHTEVVLVEFDPNEVSYQELLIVFFASHNPTTMNRQGPDMGTQYRSAVYYYDDEQKQLTDKTIEELTANNAFQGKPIVTEVTQAEEFYMAEDYHQQYLEKRGLSSCHI